MKCRCECQCPALLTDDKQRCYACWANVKDVGLKAHMVNAIRLLRAAVEALMASDNAIDELEERLDQEFAVGTDNRHAKGTA